jgi:hypothetical protein
MKKNDEGNHRERGELKLERLLAAAAGLMAKQGSSWRDCWPRRRG